MEAGIFGCFIRSKVWQIFGCLFLEGGSNVRIIMLVVLCRRLSYWEVLP